MTESKKDCECNEVSILNISDNTCSLCGAYTIISEDKLSCVDPPCLDTRNKILENGTCEICGDHEIVAEDKISCELKECIVDNREFIEVEATCTQCDSFQIPSGSKELRR